MEPDEAWHQTERLRESRELIGESRCVDYWHQPGTTGSRACSSEHLQHGDWSRADMLSPKPFSILSRSGLTVACLVAVLLLPIVSQEVRAEQMSEQAKRDFMKTCIGDKKSDKNYAEHQQQSGTTAEGKCEKELQSKMK